MLKSEVSRPTNAVLRKPDDTDWLAEQLEFFYKQPTCKKIFFAGCKCAASLALFAIADHFSQAMIPDTGMSSTN